MASKGMIETCGFKFDFESEEKTDPRNGEKYTVINCKKSTYIMAAVGSFCKYAYR